MFHDLQPSSDINECLEPGICSQLCVNVKGSYKCECVAGYAKDPHDPHRCKAMEGHASLLFADYYDIRKISLDHKEVRVFVCLWFFSVSEYGWRGGCVGFSLALIKFVEIFTNFKEVSQIGS